MVDVPPDDLDEKGPDEGRVFAPEELDITESEHVEELEEGRFVVSPDGAPNVDEKRETNRESSSSTGNETEQETPQSYDQPQPAAGTPEANRHGRAPSSPTHHRELTEEVVHRWLRQSFENHSSRYAFDVTATFDGRVSQRRMASNDVVTIFESLMLWYAQHVDSNTPVEDVLGILLAESNVPVRYPPESILRLLRSSNLTPEDTIADLLEEIEDGVQL